MHFLSFPDELKDFFSKYGNVVEHQIICDHETNRSRGFGFVIFDNEEVVDEMLSKTNMIDMAGTKVRIGARSPTNIFVTVHMFSIKAASLNMQYIYFFSILVTILIFTLILYLKNIVL